jgi:hypothetical protein
MALVVWGGSCGTAAHSAPTPGFKELALGMSRKAVAATRQLQCHAPAVLSIRPATTIAATRPLRATADRLRSRGSSGDLQCTATRPDTVGGMQISELRLTFMRDVLGRIDIGIAERGDAKPNYQGGSVWSSPHVMTLIDSLDRRFGQHAATRAPDCSAGIGGCRDAPLKIRLTWQHTDAAVTLVYWESTVYGSPTLAYTTTQLSNEQQALWQQARALDQRADAIERAAASQQALAREHDL